MPMCAFPACNQYAVKGNTRCSTHLHSNAKEMREAQRQLDALAAKEAEAQRQLERNAVAQKKADQQLARLRLQDEVIRRHVQSWNALVDGVVAQVLQLRQQDPTANAGNNAVGNTQGGTNSPVVLTMSGPTHGVTKADVLARMAGLDSSDSGLFKFRRQGVLVHCQ